jgi:hypothetical protein
MQFIALKNTLELELGCENEKLAAYPNTVLFHIFYEMSVCLIQCLVSAYMKYIFLSTLSDWLHTCMPTLV